MPKEINQIFDSAKRGIAKIRDNTTVGQTDAFRLTELEGVGPSTAENLRDAGIDTPEQLGRVTPNQLEKVEGVGTKTADKLASKFQYSRTRFDGDGDGVPDRVEDKMADRSADARRTDRSFNAPITTNEQKWLNNPDEYDYPGVDTIPTQRRANRVTEKAQRGGFNVETASLPGKTQGQQSGDTAQVDTSSSFDPVSTAAHEVGHAAESSVAGRGGLADKLFEDEQVREEAEDLAVRRRSMVKSAESIEENYDDQDVGSELIADAFAVATEEPRAAKREAPNLVKELQDETLMDFGRF